MIIKADSRFIPVKDKSVQCVVTSPPYWGLRKYDDACNLIWDVDNDCEHIWAESKMTLVHENRNFLKGSQEEVNRQKGTTYIKRYDDKKSCFCQKCGAWYGQLGLEPIYQMYLVHLKTIIDEIWRVLRDDGTFFLNIGDTYAGSNCGYGAKRKSPRGFQDVTKGYYAASYQKPPMAKCRIKAKSLVSIPERIMLMMIDSGWILRNKIAWHKPNAMPCSSDDNFNNTWEYVYFFVKSNKTLWWKNIETGEWVQKRPKYIWRHIYTGEWRERRPPKEEYYDKNKKPLYKQIWISRDYYSNLNAVRLPHASSTLKRAKYLQGAYGIDGMRMIGTQKGGKSTMVLPNPRGKNPGDVIKHDIAVGRQRNFSYNDPLHTKPYHPKGKNPGDFWEISTQPYPDAHYATFPEELVANILEFATKLGDIVLDPFAGSGTTGVVAMKMGRKAILLDLAYQNLQKERLGLFALVN